MTRFRARKLLSIVIAPSTLAGAWFIVPIAAAPAVAATQGASVSSAPASFTPYLASQNGNVAMMTRCGSTMYAVGRFSSIASPSQHAVTRNNAFSFSATSGALTSWNPNVNGTVNSITLSADCSTAYLGGRFSSVGGTAAKDIVAVSTATSAVIPTFGHNASGQVSTVLLVGSHLLVGGYFTSINSSSRGYLVSLNPTTGQNDGYLNLAVSGTLPMDSTHIYKFELSHAGTRLLASGVFTSVGEQTRQQIFMIDLGASAGTLDNWYSPLFNGVCTTTERFFVKGFNWSPDDSTVYVATTGYRGATLCDAAAAFSSQPDSDQDLLWINKTGCDSLYATVADDSNVYVGGHERWANNPKGCDAAGPGAVSRSGIGDIDPTTALATSWNPTRSRGHGIDDLYLDSEGDLWVSSDNGANQFTQCAHHYHPGICMFPAS
jgi:hypothetical protein